MPDLDLLRIAWANLYNAVLTILLRAYSIAIIRFESYNLIALKEREDG